MSKDYQIKVSVAGAVPAASAADTEAPEPMSLEELTAASGVAHVTEAGPEPMDPGRLAAGEAAEVPEPMELDELGAPDES